MAVSSGRGCERHRTVHYRRAHHRGQRPSAVHATELYTSATAMRCRRRGPRPPPEYRPPFAGTKELAPGGATLEITGQADCGGLSWNVFGFWGSVSIFSPPAKRRAVTLPVPCLHSRRAARPATHRHRGADEFFFVWRAASRFCSRTRGVRWDRAVPARARGALPHLSNATTERPDALPSCRRASSGSSGTSGTRAARRHGTASGSGGGNSTAPRHGKPVRHGARARNPRNASPGKSAWRASGHRPKPARGSSSALYPASAAEQNGWCPKRWSISPRSSERPRLPSGHHLAGGDGDDRVDTATSSPGGFVPSTCIAPSDISVYLSDVSVTIDRWHPKPQQAFAGCSGTTTPRCARGPPATLPQRKPGLGCGGHPQAFDEGFRSRRLPLGRLTRETVYRHRPHARRES